MDDRQPRRAVPLHGTVLRGVRRPLVPARRPSWLDAVDRLGAVLRRHCGGLRPSDACARSAPGARRRRDAAGGGRVGCYHRRHQGQRAQPRAAREDAALSARRLGAAARRRRACGARKDHRHSVGSRARLARLPDRAGDRHQLRRLVRPGAALFRHPAGGIHVPHPAVRRGGGSPRAERAVDAGVRGSGGAGRGRPRHGEPARRRARSGARSGLNPLAFQADRGSPACGVDGARPVWHSHRVSEEFGMATHGIAPRRRSVPVDVAGVTVGGTAPVVVQSMTNTDTADAEATARQVAALVRAGSELVRITVDRDEAAAAVPHIKDRLRKMNVDVPIVGDFHYIGHKLLADHPACAEALDKYRINPGNVGFKEKKDRQFGAIVETAIRHGKPVRIGANWGSLDQELLTRLMDENARFANPKDAREVTREAMVQSALLSAARAEEIGLPRNRIILSAKVSAVQDLIAVYEELGKRSDYALHLGLTEAGMGSKGIVASSAAMGILLQQGIGDTTRVSLTPEPGGDRTLEVKVAQELLQTMGLRSFVPIVAACPGCGRTTSTVFQELASDIQGYVRERMAVWRGQYPGVEGLNVAVMGCIVNGPGESKHADIGISLPGTGEQPAAPVFIDGKKVATLRGPTVAADFKQMVIDYIERRYGAVGAGRTAAE